jgi:hypothetical protein
LFILLSIHGYCVIVEKIILFALLFLLFLVISENSLITIFLSLFIFLIINLLMLYQRKMKRSLELRKQSQIMERFDNETKKDEKKEMEQKEESESGGAKMAKILLGGADINLDLLKKDKTIPSGETVAELAKKMNGGIELKNSDLEETKPLGIDAKDYANDKKPSAMREAQRETYELINTVNTLKETLTTLSPILQEGKKLMEVFESFRI